MGTGIPLRAAVCYTRLPLPLLRSLIHTHGGDINIRDADGDTVSAAVRRRDGGCGLAYFQRNLTFTYFL